MDAIPQAAMNLNKSHHEMNQVISGGIDCQKLKPFVPADTEFLEQAVLNRFVGKKQKRETSERKRNVRFSNARLENKSQTPSASYATTFKKEDVWWSNEEINKFQLQTRMELRMLTQESRRLPEYFQHYEMMFQLCVNTPSIDVLLASPRNTILQESARLKTPFNGSLRGLEHRLIPSLGCYRKFHIKNLLSAQKSLSFCYDETLLKANSLKTSRCSQLMARLVGHSDAQEVLSLLLLEDQLKQGS